MKRNNDLLREILFDFEAQDDWKIIGVQTKKLGAEDLVVYGHLHLLIDADLVARVGGEAFRMTNAGHDYLEAIRSDTIWHKTMDGVEKVGGMTLVMIKDLALSYVKQEVATKLGISL